MSSLITDEVVTLTGRPWLRCGPASCARRARRRGQADGGGRDDEQAPAAGGRLVRAAPAAPTDAARRARAAAAAGASRNRNLPSSAAHAGSPLSPLQLRCCLVLSPATGDDWLALTDDGPAGRRGLRLGRADRTVVRSSCSPGRFATTPRGATASSELVYEAYEEAAGERFAAIAAEARTRWPTIGRLAMIHRLGSLAVTDSAVVVAVSAPHRDEAFEAARFVIDTLKATVPIWKHETWRTEPTGAPALRRSVTSNTSQAGRRDGPDEQMIWSSSVRRSSPQASCCSFSADGGRPIP